MARIDNLNNFLTDVATAIKDKTGKTEPITPANFDTEIASIETSGGGSTITKGLVIDACDENGYVTDVSIVGMDNIPDYYCEKMFSSSIYSSGSGRNINIHLPETINSIGTKAFYELRTITINNLPNTITSIGDNAFYYCYNLEFTALPSSLTSIGNNAFYSCDKIKITELPSTLTSIGSYAFYYCKTIERLTFLGDTLNISSGAFSYCSNLKYLILPNVTSVPTLASSVFTSTPIGRNIKNLAYIYVPDDLVDSFKSATNWSMFANIITPISELEVE